MSVETYRAEREAVLRRDAEQCGVGTIAAWAVRKGDVEVRRQVDDDAIVEALRLLASIDKRRYVRHPEIRDALNAAQDAVMVAGQTSTQRTWDAFNADVARGAR